MKNGEIYETKNVTEENQWSWTFEEVAKYEKGKEINYSIMEEAVADYSTTYNGYDVTNSYTPGKVSVSITKAWQDNENQDGIRPNDITVQLIADGKAVSGKTLILNDGNQWTGSFIDLPEYQKGEKVVYTVDEVEVEGYETVITGTTTEGFVITNSHTPKKIYKPDTSADIDSPQTGDDSNSEIYIMLALIALGGIGLTVLNRKNMK